jgi:hypothetical protein
VRLSQSRGRRLDVILNELMNKNGMLYIASKMAGLTAVGMCGVIFCMSCSGSRSDLLNSGFIFNLRVEEVSSTETSHYTHHIPDNTTLQYKIFIPRALLTVHRTFFCSCTGQ